VSVVFYLKVAGAVLKHFAVFFAMFCKSPTLFCKSPTPIILEEVFTIPLPYFALDKSKQMAFPLLVRAKSLFSLIARGAQQSLLRTL